MKFGKSWDDVKKEPKGGGGSFIKYPGEGETTIRILDEPSEWEGAWEHFADGKSFPCTGERDTCPGCTDPREKVKSASRKIYFNAVSMRNDKQYVDVWKVTRKLADKLELRAKKDGSIRLRDYTFTRIGSGTDTEYDLDSSDKDGADLSKFLGQRKNINRALVDAFIDANGEDKAAELGVTYEPEDGVDPSGVPATEGSTQESGTSGPADSEPASGSSDPATTERADEVARLQAQLKEAQAAAKAPKEEPKAEPEPEAKEEYVHPDSPRAESGDDNDPPFEPTPEGEPAKEDANPDREADVDPGEFEGTIEDLRAMTKGKLVEMITTEAKWGRLTLPNWSLSNKTAAQLVEWLLEQE